MCPPCSHNIQVLLHLVMFEHDCRVYLAARGESGVYQWFQTAYIDPEVPRSSLVVITQVQWREYMVSKPHRNAAGAGLISNCFIYLIYVQFCLNKMPLSLDRNSLVYQVAAKNYLNDHTSFFSSGFSYLVVI